jgi:CHAT domain-containing protein
MFRAKYKSVLIIADQADSGAYEQLPHIATEADILKSMIPSDDIIGVSIHDTHISSAGFTRKIASNVELLHFACHGSQDQSNPFQSGLELRAGRLTLDQLTNITFPNGRLAYLSACETASINPADPDSGMNIATTFLFNEFRSVIGSMW